jgi:hypothetical protein
VHFSIEAFQ